MSKKKQMPKFSFTQSVDRVKRANFRCEIRIDKETLETIQKIIAESGEGFHSYLRHCFWTGFHADVERHKEHLAILKESATCGTCGAPCDPNSDQITCPGCDIG